MTVAAKVAASAVGVGLDVGGGEDWVLEVEVGRCCVGGSGCGGGGVHPVGRRQGGGRVTGGSLLDFNVGGSFAW